MPPVTRFASALVIAAASLTFAMSSTVSATAPAGGCKDVSNTSSEPVIDPASLSTFGPLAPDPALRIESADTIADASYVPGGVLIETTADVGSTIALAVADDSGAIRWRRCLPAETYLDVFVAPPPAKPDTVLVVRYSASGALSTEIIDLVSGTVEPVKLANGPLEFASSSPGWVLLRPSSVDPAPAEPSLTLVDLSSVTPSNVPMPNDPAAVGPALVAGSGVVGVGEPDAPSVQVAAVFVDGAWTTDAAAIDAEFGVYSDYAHDKPMTFYRASGSVAFTTDLVSAADEGFHDLQVGDVELARGCTNVDPETFLCEGAALAAFDVTTGAELWRLDGEHWVPAAGDGYAIVGGPIGPNVADDANTMVDLRTGTPVDGQSWPLGTFVSGCCGDPAFTVAEGGALLTWDGSRLSLYVPAAAATPTLDASI